MNTETYNIIGNIAGPLIVGLIIWILGERANDKRTKNEAIRDLMTFRGDFASPEFRRSLNKISITFHKDSDTRKEIRELYEAINNPNSLETNVNRKIVGLIYNLCTKNGFDGITEYDIDQSFPEQKQTPTSTSLQISNLDEPKIPNIIAKAIRNKRQPKTKK